MLVRLRGFGSVGDADGVSSLEFGGVLGGDFVSCL